MGNAYRIHGARFLRKYTAAEKSSCYAYMADVRKIANTLCKVPWERVSGDIAATNTIHTEEGLDWNAPERDRFDAAEWCGEHSDGFHRAFAQAACYVFKLPTSAIGTEIEKIRVNVTSDPYNPYGARIAAMTSATLDIPMECATVREGEVFRAPDENGLGAAPRIFVTNAKTGKETWYSNNEIVELVPEASLEAKQYLFVFVCLENYNRGRDGWIEGSSYIDNDVELTLASACSDLDDAELNDLSAVVPQQEFNVARGGVYPMATGAISGVKGASVMLNGDDLAKGTPVDVVTEIGFVKVENTEKADAEDVPFADRGSALSAVIETNPVLIHRTSGSSNGFYQYLLAYTKDVACMKGDVNENGVTNVLAGIRWRKVIAGNSYTHFPIPSDATGAELANACRENGVQFAFVEYSGSGSEDKNCRVHVFPGNGYEYEFNVELPHYGFFRNSEFPETCSRSSVTGVPVCNGWTDAIFLDGNRLKCNEFPRDIPVSGTVTAVKRMIEMDGDDVKGTLKFIVSGNLKSVDGVWCRNCAIVTVGDSDVEVSVPEWDANITPDNYVDFAVVPKTPRLLYTTGVASGGDGFYVTGSFSTLNGSPATAFATIEDGEVVGGRITIEDRHFVSLRGSAFLVGDGLFASGAECVSRKCIMSSDVFGGGSDEQSCIGLRELYERIYDGKLDDAIQGHKGERCGVGFVVERSEKLMEIAGVPTELSNGYPVKVSDGVPIWRMSLSSLCVPFSVPTKFAARKIALDWSDWDGEATAGKINVWLKRGAWVSDLPGEVLKNPRIYDASEKDVDGWELIGTVDPTADATSAVFDLASPLSGYVASLMFTAFVSLDDQNPTSETVAKQGVSTDFSADTIDDVVTSDGLWRPDITLIG